MTKTNKLRNTNKLTLAAETLRALGETLSAETLRGVGGGLNYTKPLAKGCP